jgi:hypothetical protein
MAYLKRILKVSLALVLFITVLGCTTTPLTDEQIASNALGAYPQVNTVKMNMDMSMTMDAVGGQEPLSYQMEMTADGLVDMKKTAMSLSMNIDIDITELEAQNLSTDMYIVDGWVYMKIDMPKLGAQWIKSKLDDSLWTRQNQLEQQMQLLKSAIGIKSLGNETINGSNCYVLEITPDMAALSDFVNSQLGSQAGADALQDTDLSKMFKSVTIKEWLARDTFLPARMEMNLKMEMNREDFSNSTEGYEKLAVDMAMTTVYSDYNKPVAITLPPEAAKAVEQSLSK